MSRYEWESGTIKLPAKEYPSFRKAMMMAWNSRQGEMLSVARGIYPEVKQATKTMTGCTLQDFIQRKISARTRGNWRDVYNLMYNQNKFRCPRLSHLDLRKISIGSTLHFDEATVSFFDKNCTVEWDVTENNHSIDHAREHPIAKEFFRMLHKINWVRGTGGKIVGNDEYNRDSGYEGGGANYITQQFGP